MNQFDPASLKRTAAARALDYVTDGMKLGLGTGSTAEALLELLAERVRAGLKVDDLAPQLFRSPLLFRVEVCRNIEFNQFRHDVLLAGDPTPLRELSTEPMPESGPVKVHISLFLTLVSFFSKLTATYKNTKVKEELLAGMREKTQVW